MLEALAVAFATVFTAELGDKSQLLVLSLAARYRRRVLIAAVVCASALMMALSVAVGAAVGRFLPTGPLNVAAGVAFVAFGLLTLREDDDEEEREHRGDDRGGVLAVTGAIVVAELGDKTMLAALALAATRSPLGVWAGATLGMAAAGSVAALVGAALWRRLEQRTVRLVSAGLFVLVGLVLVAEGLGTVLG